MLHALTHGWMGLFLGYGLTVIGIWTGLRLIHAQGGRTLWVVKVSIPVMLGAATLWWIIEDLGARFFRTLPKDVTAWLGMGFLPSASALIGVALVYRGSDTHKRGALVREVVTWFRRKGSPRGQLTIAGVPVPLEDETKHFKIIGTTGTGKSTAIQELLAGALKRGDRAVIADPDGAYARAPGCGT